MAPRADLLEVLSQDRLAFAGMRIVATDTSAATGRHMGKPGLPGVLDRAVVTLTAQLVDGLDRRKGVSSRG